MLVDWFMKAQRIWAVIQQLNFNGDGGGQAHTARLAPLTIAHSIMRICGLNQGGVYISPLTLEMALSWVLEPSPQHTCTQRSLHQVAEQPS